MKKIVVANWKMHGLRLKTINFTNYLSQHLQSRRLHDKCLNIEVVFCPPFTTLGFCTDGLFALGGQDCHTQETTEAFTGCISAEMLRDLRCQYVIVGHSERRKYFRESNLVIKEKALAACNTGLIPMICLGEDKQENLEKVLSHQCRECIPNTSVDFIIAYEPIWAIGSEHSATNEHINKAVAIIRQYTHVRIIYGGAVTLDNINELIGNYSLSGVLIGRASHNISLFLQLIDKIIDTEIIHP